jgi:hypothetical protein
MDSGRGAEPPVGTITRTRPSWMMRTASIGVATHALYLISPWFTPPTGFPGFGRADLWAYMQTSWGRSVLFLVEAGLVVLLWRLSTRNSGLQGRWYHR